MLIPSDMVLPHCLDQIVDAKWDRGNKPTRLSLLASHFSPLTSHFYVRVAGSTINKVLLSFNLTVYKSIH